MENATNMNENFFILNTTNMVQQNSTLPSQFSTWTIITVTVCSIGILANILVIFTIVVSSLKYSVLMNLIMHLAIFDNMCLISEITFQRGLFGHLFIKPSLPQCRLNTFFLYVFAIISSWITVFMSLERYIALYYPFKVHIYCTKMHTSFGIIVLKIVTCISCIPCFYSCYIRWLDGMHVCRTFGENSKHIIISMSNFFSTLQHSSFYSDYHFKHFDDEKNPKSVVIYSPVFIYNPINKQQLDYHILLNFSYSWY